MSVYPHKRSGRLTGRWVAETVINGTRVRTMCDTQAEGERWVLQAKKLGAAPEQEAKPAGKTLGEVAEEAKQGKDTWRSQRDPAVLHRLEWVVDTIGRGKAFAEVSTADLDRVVAALERRPSRDKQGKMSPATINRYLTAASAVLRFGAKRRYRDGMPEVPWQKAESKRIHWATEELEDAICAYLADEGHPTFALAVRVLAATGLRWGEFETLAPEQVVVTAEAGWVKLDKTKTDTPRDVPIDAQLATDLRAMVAANAVPNYQTFYKWFKRAAKECGANAGLTVHSLRHTTATRLTRANVATPIVQKFLGHKNINTTLKYVHVEADDLLQASKKVSQRVGQSASATVPAPERAREGEVREAPAAVG